MDIDGNISHNLISAVKEGKLETVREIINNFGLSYSPSWSEGYVLLRDALQYQHREVAKLLLANGSKVNSKNKNSSTPLHFTVLNGDVEIIKILLDRGATINAKNRFGTTPLHHAVVTGKIEIIELLLNRGANVDAKEKSRATALHIAVARNYLQIVKYLLKHGANVNAYTSEYFKGCTPLHIAVLNRREEIIKLLLISGANVNAAAKDGRTALYIAAEYGDLQNIQHLLQYGAHINFTYTSGFSECYRPLHGAVLSGSEEIVKLLLNRGADVNVKGKDGRIALYIAAEYGHLQNVQHLLQHGAYINFAYTSGFREGFTPLHGAVLSGSEEIVKLLLSRGAYVNAKTKSGKTALHIAAEQGHLQNVEHLLQHGAYVNVAYTSGFHKGFTPLHGAVRNGREEIVKLLLSSGANVNAKGENGTTALYIAVEKEYSQIVEHLVNHRANINFTYNSRFHENFTALHLAVRKGNEKIVKLLLSSGANVNAKGENGTTALYIAAEWGYSQIVKELLQFGGDVNVLYNSTFGEGYNMPLHVASKYDHEDVAKLLISCGADINAKDETGKSPMFYAIENCNVKIFELLLSTGANVKDNPELLHIAVKVSRDIVENLLQHGANINSSDKNGKTALHFVAFFKNGDDYGKGQIANLLLSKGADVNARTKNDITTLHFASRNGYVKLVEVLLAHNADVNSTDLENDITPLHLSAREGNKEICKMLLNRGANINAKQKDGTTAFHNALERGHKEVVEILLECGAKFESKVKNDITPFHIVAKKNHYELVEVLLKFGAEIDSTDEYGRTALHIAAQYGHVETVRTLLECGSDVNVISKNNHTVHDFLDTGVNCYSNDNANHNSDNNCDKFTRLSIVEILERHVIKMKAANLFVNNKNLLFNTYDARLYDFQYLCKKEVTSMKSEKINNTNILFYDILTMDINHLARYARNESMLQVLKSNVYKRKYPIYYNMINNHIKRGERRNKLLERNNEIFDFFSNNFMLPQECTENIFNYLSNEQLRIFRDAF